MNLLKKLPLVALVFGLAVIGLTSAFKTAPANSGTLTELYGNLDGTGWVSLDGYTESNSGAPGTYTCNDENPHEERPCTALYDGVGEPDSGEIQSFGYITIVPLN